MLTLWPIYSAGCWYVVLHSYNICYWVRRVYRFPSIS